MLLVVSKYLNTVKQCLSTFLIQKLCAFGKTFISWSKNKHKTVEKKEMLKILTALPFLNYRHKYIGNLLWKSGLTIAIFPSMKKKISKFRSKKKDLLNLTIPNDFFIISKRAFDATLLKLWLTIGNCDVMDSYMPSIWCKTSNFKILHRIFQIFSDNQFFQKNYFFLQFCACTPFHLLTILKNNEEKMRQAMLWVCNIVQGEGRILNTFFKIPIIFRHWLSEIYENKIKIRFYACCFKKLKCALMSLIMLQYTLSWT